MRKRETLKVKSTNSAKLLLVVFVCLLLIPSCLAGSFQPKPPKVIVPFQTYTEEDTLKKPLLPLTLTETDSQFIYESSLGTYKFNKADVVWSFTSREGVVLSPSTRFLIQFMGMFDDWLDVPYVTVGTVDVSRTFLHYTITLETTFGVADVLVSFSSTSPPKFTLTYNKGIDIDTRIIWKTTVPQAWKYFSLDMKATTDLSDNKNHEHVVDHVCILNTTDFAKSKIALMVDWRDFGNATVMLKGSTVTVIFPTNLNKVDPTLYDYYDSGDDTQDGMPPWYGANGWLGQTFTTTSNYYLSKISVKIYKVGTPGTLTVSLRATSGNLPTGSDLTSGTIAEGAMNTTAPGSWHNVTVSSVLLVSGTKYAIVARCSAGTGPADCVYWRRDSTGTYAAGNAVISLDASATWSMWGAAYDFMFRTYGEGYNFNFAGCFWENTGLLKTASERAVNVTAHFTDAILDETFEVNGTYAYATSNEVLFFSFNISATKSEYVVSQYGMNLLVYNQSASYDILFPIVEPDTNYEVNCTLSWDSTYTIGSEAVTGCTVTFNVVPNELSNYLNYYVYRTVSASSEKNREYWVSANEIYGSTIYIFDGDLTAYDIGFLDLAGVLNQYPHVAAKRYVNGTLMIVEKRKVDENNHITMNLINGKKYTLTIENSATVYTWGEIQMTSTTSIQLTLRGVDFPKETLLTYKNVYIYGYRTFASPNGTIVIWYYDSLNQTVSVIVNVDYSNGTLAATTTQTTNSWSYTFTDMMNDTNYQVEATITHTRYGVMAWKQYTPCEIEAGTTLSLDWLGGLQIDTSIIIPSIIILMAAGCFSVINAETGAIMACFIAGTMTAMRIITITPGFLITAFFFAFAMALVYAKRRVSYG